MIINYDQKKLSDALFDFYNATGINLMLLKEDFSRFMDKNVKKNKYCHAVQSTDEGLRLCGCSDKKILEKCKKSRKTEYHVCHAGLVDVVVPIIYDDNILGYIILGQMKQNEDFESVKKYISHLFVDVEELKNFYDSLVLFDRNKIQSIVSLATMLSKHILLENMIKPRINKNVEDAVNFINMHLEQDLNINYISRMTNVSKSVLYKNFHSIFNCTVSEYINAKRVEKSVHMLLNTDLSMEEIARNVGFSTGSYYSKTFKKIKGISPLKFRKNNAK